MNVCCVKCGQPGDETTIGVDVDSGDIHCAECDETYTVEDVEAHVAAWAKLLPWLRQHPARQQTPACEAVAK